MQDRRQFKAMSGFAPGLDMAMSGAISGVVGKNPACRLGSIPCSGAFAAVDWRPGALARTHTLLTVRQFGRSRLRLRTCNYGKARYY
jgi:hypothetical protein